MPFDYDDLFPGGEQAPQQPEDGLDAFLDGLPEMDIPTDYVRIVSSIGGGVRDVPIDPTHEVNGLVGYTLRDVLQMGQLTYNDATQFWAGETQINLDHILATGAQVTAVGIVKGG